MPGIDESLTFYPLRIAVLTVSDTRTRGDGQIGRPARRAGRGGGPRAGGQGDRARRASRRSRRRCRPGSADPRGGPDHLHRRHRLRAARRDARGGEAAAPARDGRLRCGLPPRQLEARSASPPSSRAPSPGRSATRSSSACRARPAPAATAGISSSRSSWTAATGPARSPGRSRGSGISAHEQAQPCRRGRPRDAWST